MAHVLRAVRSAREKYAAFFSVAEIASEPILQWSFGACLLFFYATFSVWINSTATTIGTAQRGAAICWPYFQDCFNLYFLQGLPDGYSQTVFYMALYGVMLVIAWRMWARDWVLAHALMTLLFLWKFFVVFALSYLIAGPYDYFHLIFTAILLFLPLKEYFLKLGFVFLYFMSVTTKFDDTWILGTYFSTLKGGLPLFPHILTLPLTEFVIFMQVIGAWFLLSRRRVLQRLAFGYFVLFHLYSGILVLYLYPTVSLPLLLILFGPMYRHTPIPFSRKAIAGWALLAVVVLFQAPGFLISADRRMTLEGNRFGMFMFEANHQCVADVRIYRTSADASPKNVSGRMSCTEFYCLTRSSDYYENGSRVYESRYESGDAWNRCDPYVWWAEYHALCGTGNVTRVAFTFDHSINGGPFYRIVDVPNLCDLAYRPFTHNAWITLPPAAPVIGYPVKDVYRY